MIERRSLRSLGSLTVLFMLPHALSSQIGVVVKRANIEFPRPNNEEAIELHSLVVTVRVQHAADSSESSNL